jgi:hypothetical protein
MEREFAYLHAAFLYLAIQMFFATLVRAMLCLHMVYFENARWVSLKPGRAACIVANPAPLPRC